MFLLSTVFHEDHVVLVHDIVNATDVFTVLFKQLYPMWYPILTYCFSQRVREVIPFGFKQLIALRLPSLSVYMQLECRKTFRPQISCTLILTRDMVHFHLRSILSSYILAFGCCACASAQSAVSEKDQQRH